MRGRTNATIYSYCPSPSSSRCLFRSGFSASLRPVTSRSSAPESCRPLVRSRGIARQIPPSVRAGSGPHSVSCRSGVRLGACWVCVRRRGSDTRTITPKNRQPTPAEAEKHPDEASRGRERSQRRGTPTPGTRARIRLTGTRARCWRGQSAPLSSRSPRSPLSRVIRLFVTAGSPPFDPRHPPPAHTQRTSPVTNEHARRTPTRRPGPHRYQRASRCGPSVRSATSSITRRVDLVPRRHTRHRPWGRRQPTRPTP